MEEQRGAWRFLIFRTLAVALLIFPSVSLAGWRLERIASGLSQPTYVTQAPGDPANILYYTTRTSISTPNAGGGFGANNPMGKVWRYDVNTRTSSTVLDLSARRVTNDDGLQTIAFHPDFNNPGTLGYQKFYVASAEYPNPGNAVDRVEEYTVGTLGTASFTRLILQYTNNTQNNHTVDWVGFDPNAAGAARNYLYITTGDSSFGNSYNGGVSPTGRPSQNPTDVRGKMLRVDITPGAVDAYADVNKNFAIPPSNPYPVWNLSHGTQTVNGSGEVYISGLRNSFRASFDRTTSDMYMGDVGENLVEELDFLKANTNNGATTPAVDYGWPQKEGTNNSGISGAPQTDINPFYPAGTSTSLKPIQQFSHTAGGNAIIGGYVYHGPVPELQGKYFYADFVPAGRIWMLDFDRNTATTSFNGNNGTLTDVSARWNSRVFDPNDPTYVSSSSITDLAGIDHVVSFGEDNLGNLYVVDFGNRTLGTGTQSGFDGQYPHALLGEIFRVTAGTITGNWNVNANGNWFTPANWTPGGVPGMLGDQANFGGIITAPRTVTVDAPQTVSTMTFDSAQSYTISGSSTLTLQGASPAVFTVNNGTHTITAPVALGSDLTVQTNTAGSQLVLTWGQIDATGRTITKLGPGLVQFVNIRGATLLASEGTVKIAPQGIANSTVGVSVLNSLTIGASGKLDLTNNSLIVDYTGPVGTLVGDTRANLQSGKLFSSSADATRGLGYGDNAVLGITSFAGQTPDASSLLVKYTYFGDVNLDGQVDITDLGTLATNWQSAGVWTGGDVNYDGFVDITDLGLLATNWQAGVGSPLGPGSLQQALASLGLPGSAVPEPASIGLMGLVAWSLKRPRRRRITTSQ